MYVCVRVCVCVCVCVPTEHCIEAPVNIWPMCQWLVGEVPQDITLENVLACSRQQQCSLCRECLSVCICVCVCICKWLYLRCVSVRDDCITFARKVLCVSEFKMIVFLCVCVCVCVCEGWLCSTCVCKIVFLCVCVGSFYFPPLALNPFLSRRLILPLITI